MTPAIFDDFLPHVDAMRDQALASPFVDLEHDGEIYKRVWIGEVPGLQDAIEDKIGPVQMLGMGYRLNFDGELPNARIHSDLGWGTHAAVLYLSEGDSGTAFWEHIPSGSKAIHAGDVALFEQLKDDWNDADQWRQLSFVPMKLNRALIYESALFHSRYPFEAFGTGPQDGRLVAVAFFNLLEPTA